MTCRLLDKQPHRNARSIRYKINVLANEINDNSKNFRGLTYKELVKAIITNIKDIIRLIDEELQVLTPTSSGAEIFKQLRIKLELLVFNIGYFCGLSLDLVSIRQLTAEELFKIESSYKIDLKKLGYIKEAK